jgi:hypothetical protein
LDRSVSAHASMANPPAALHGAWLYDALFWLINNTLSRRRCCFAAGCRALASVMGPYEETAIVA